MTPKAAEKTVPAGATLLREWAESIARGPEVPCGCHTEFATALAGGKTVSELAVNHVVHLVRAIPGYARIRAPSLRGGTENWIRSGWEPLPISEGSKEFKTRRLIVSKHVWDLTWDGLLPACMRIAASNAPYRVQLVRQHYRRWIAEDPFEAVLVEISTTATADRVVFFRPDAMQLEMQLST